MAVTFLSGEGAGFELAGKKLAGNAHNPTSLREGRLRAIVAAKTRSKRAQLCGGGRLGGSRMSGGLNLAAMAARAAARRQADDGWCQSAQVIELEEEQPLDWLSTTGAAGLGTAGQHRAVAAGPTAATVTAAAASGGDGAYRSAAKRRKADDGPGAASAVAGCSSGGSGGGGGSGEVVGGRVRVCIGPGRWVSRSATSGRAILEPMHSATGLAAAEHATGGGGGVGDGGGRRYRCVARCVIRAGRGQESAAVGVLQVGAEVTAVEEHTMDGVGRTFQAAGNGGGGGGGASTVGTIRSSVSSSTSSSRVWGAERRMGGGGCDGNGGLAAAAEWQWQWQGAV